MYAIQQSLIILPNISLNIAHTSPVIWTTICRHEQNILIITVSWERWRTCLENIKQCGNDLREHTNIFDVIFEAFHTFHPLRYGFALKRVVYTRQIIQIDIWYKRQIHTHTHNSYKGSQLYDILFNCLLPVYRWILLLRVCARTNSTNFASNK